MVEVGGEGGRWGDNRFKDQAKGWWAGKRGPGEHLSRNKLLEEEEELQACCWGGNNRELPPRTRLPSRLRQ